MPLTLTLFLFLLCTLQIFISPSATTKPPLPLKAIYIPARKDSSTLQYVAPISQRTPLVPVKLLVDLGGDAVFVDCEKNYVSSSYRPINCRSARCNLAGNFTCGDSCSDGNNAWYCSKNACYTFYENPVKLLGYIAGGEAAEDVLSVQSIPGQAVSMPRFIFSCVAAHMVRGLGSGVKGVAGLGRTSAALSTQLVQAFKLRTKFSICLNPSIKSNGIITFGDHVPPVHASKPLIYTPLLNNPFTTRLRMDGPSADYFIQITAIKINGKDVPINTTLLSIDKSGNGGTRISTVHPYTTLHSSIHKAFTQAFIKQFPNVTRVSSVPPFEACLNSRSIPRTPLGPAVPPVDLVLHNRNVHWRISGANSMVQVGKDVLCLAFVKGGHHLVTTSIVIGAHQIEDNLLEFDLARSRLGFSSSLLFHGTTCGNYYNMTTSQARSGQT